MKQVRELARCLTFKLSLLGDAPFPKNTPDAKSFVPQVRQVPKIAACGEQGINDWECLSTSCLHSPSHTSNHHVRAHSTNPCLDSNFYASRKQNLRFQKLLVAHKRLPFEDLNVNTTDQASSTGTFGGDARRSETDSSESRSKQTTAGKPRQRGKQEPKQMSMCLQQDCSHQTIPDAAIIAPHTGR